MKFIKWVWEDTRELKWFVKIWLIILLGNATNAAIREEYHLAFWIFFSTIMIWLYENTSKSLDKWVELTVQATALADALSKQNKLLLKTLHDDAK